MQKVSFEIVIFVKNRCSGSHRVLKSKNVIAYVFHIFWLDLVKVE
jgi:hypothetical protein